MPTAQMPCLSIDRYTFFKCKKHAALCLLNDMFLSQGALDWASALLIVSRVGKVRAVCELLWQSTDKRRHAPAAVSAVKRCDCRGHCLSEATCVRLAQRL